MVKSTMVKNNMRASVKVSRHAGFTLIEIMVVVAIIAILGAAVVPKIMSNPDKARVVRAKTDIGKIAQALEMYKLDNYAYPSTDQGLMALVEKPSGDPEPANWSDGYLKSLQKDPWGRDYIYVSPGENGDFDLISLAADGVEGGEGVGEDISNAN